jgi:hypothetical protein
MRRGESWAPATWVSVLAAFALLVVPSVAFAQATRTFVSGVGDDANPCSRQAPCKTWAGAISKTATGGEVDALDSGGFGALTITKAITISGVGVNASVLVAGTNGFVIQAGATGQVLIRDINFQGIRQSASAGLTGIDFVTGASLRVEGGEISDFADDGILDQSSTPGSKLVVEGTSINDNSGDGVLIAPPSGAAGSAVLDHDSVDNNACGVVAAAFGPLSATSFTTNCDTNSSGSAATSDSVVVADSTADDNAGAGMMANGSPAQEQLAGDLVTDNGTGLDPLGGGAIIESGLGNSVLGNTTNGSPTSTEDQLTATQGATGLRGATGKIGAAGDIELITCKRETKTEKVHGKKRKVTKQVCKGKVISGKVKFTLTGQTVHATLTRSGRTYAAGTMLVPDATSSTGLFSLRRRLPDGRYTLTLWHGKRAISRRTIRIGAS